MNEQYPSHQYEDRAEVRDRRENYQQPYSQPHNSPPSSASPFAFAPPPLSAAPRPPLPLHHSEPVTQPYYYQPRPPQPVHHNTYPYTGSHPIGYRSYTGETPRRDPSPPPASSSYPYPRPNPYPVNQESPRQANMYPPAPPGYYSQQPYAPPAAADMPRSLSYPSNYSQPYSYLPSISNSAHSNLPPLSRHTSDTPVGMGHMDVNRPSLGYSFANRLPLVDRPFKCDECVQSFNRNHDLKRHKRIHLSVKPFGCDKCGKTFSRKDALRRHWLVKGCRGEDGATAPITPTYPLNGPAPPTPPRESPNEYASGSYSHPAAPPPLSVLPSRQASDSSQIILTPDEIAAREEAARQGQQPLEEPNVIDPSIGHEGPSNADSSYFDGVVGLRRDGTALIDKGDDYRYPSSPYQRPVSPRQSIQQQPRSFSPISHDTKPVFAMPFAPQGQAYAVQQREGMLAPPHSQEMEKQGSEGESQNWQPSRWHRPSFPFPPPPGSNYNYVPGSPVDVGDQGYA